MSAPTDDGLCALIATVLPRAAARGGVKPSMSLRADLGVDSVGLMSIVFVLEEQVGIDAFGNVDRFVSAEYVSDIIKIVREG
ncbi:acyl carrier protein [Actinocorallia sp. API 0066]|uniref:acyl carrier protein n=1 Tax=Actinocorallia sp. API 0066 TaxID=2896846 RepID=UPI001E2F4EDC|nr:acyl carrier protein [Actinocorallia sp. API 0066]MCD0453405.1 acyl carrier protein [Actinocorallia sp. API 0066]